jgi:hypothetical protein
VDEVIAGRRKRREAQPSRPIPNWALTLVRNQPETVCIADNGRVLARGRSQPLTASESGLWVAVTQSPLRIPLRQARWVTRGDRLTFDIPLGLS